MDTLDQGLFNDSEQRISIWYLSTAPIFEVDGNTDQLNGEELPGFT